MGVARKTITVPKDKVAEVALDYNEAKSDQLIELTFNDEDFYFLWKAGIFEFINVVADADIADFESETITNSDKIKSVVTMLFKRSLFADEKLKEHLLKIIDLFEEALQRKVGVYFFF